MSAIMDPERPYTSYQRREVVNFLAERKGITIFEAGELFKTMEFSDLDKLREFVKNFPKDPPEPEDE